MLKYQTQCESCARRIGNFLHGWIRFRMLHAARLSMAKMIGVGRFGRRGENRVSQMAWISALYDPLRGLKAARIDTSAGLELLGVC